MTVHLSKCEIERPLNPAYYYGLFNIFIRESSIRIEPQISYTTIKTLPVKLIGTHIVYSTLIVIYIYIFFFLILKYRSYTN